MGDVQVRLKISGVRKILRGSDVQRELLRRTRRAAAVAGDGFEAVVRPGRYTARSLLWTTTQEAREREANEKVLIRALDAMR